MTQNQKIGNWSLRYSKAPFILESSSIVGTKESEGPLADKFDLVGDDDKFGQDTWEEAESCLQSDALRIALGKAGLKSMDLDYIFAGDLLGQAMATTFGLKKFQIPLFGLYGACSTCGEAISLASAFVAAGYGHIIAAVTSSHFGSAEKQFRFPNQYASYRPECSTWTVTGAGAFIISTSGDVKIEGITTGKVVDYGIKDSMNMGAAMAPAAAELIINNLNDFERKPEDYDKIVTGDLGKVGQQILIDLCKEKGVDISRVHEDCGMKIFDLENQDVGSGGSGCGCSATVLSSYYLPRLRSGKLKRILFVPTGALLSPVSFNEGHTVPGIAHGIVLEGK